MSLHTTLCRQIPIALCLLALAVTPGCSKKKSGDAAADDTNNNCAAVGETLARLTAVKFEGLEGRQKKIMQTQLQLVREEFTTTCEKEKWSSEMRTCMTTAGDVAAFNACTAPLRKARGLPPPATGARPAPTGPKTEPAPPPAAPEAAPATPAAP